MGKVLMEITMSLDGYIAGPDVSADDPLGRNGESLHDWMFAGKSGEEVERFQADLFSSIGAVIVGRRMADLGIENWGDDPTYHAPVFVVTHRPAATIVKKGGTSYTFVTDGIEAAMAQARAAAGGQDVIVMGGADIDRQFLKRWAHRRGPPAPLAHAARRRHPAVRRRPLGPAACPERGDKRLTRNAPGLRGRRDSRPRVAATSPFETKSAVKTLARQRRTTIRGQVRGICTP